MWGRNHFIVSYHKLRDVYSLFLCADNTLRNKINKGKFRSGIQEKEKKNEESRLFSPLETFILLTSLFILKIGDEKWEWFLMRRDLQRVCIPHHLHCSLPVGYMLPSEPKGTMPKTRIHAVRHGDLLPTNMVWALHPWRSSPLHLNFGSVENILTISI